MEKEVGERKQRLNELTVLKNNTLSAEAVPFFFFFKSLELPLAQRIFLIQEKDYGSEPSCCTKEEMRMKN